MKAFCRENVEHFFSNLDAVWEKYPFAPSQIYNMDETGSSTVPTAMGKIVTLKGMKRVRQIVSAERGSLVILAFCVNAAGTQMPLFYLFPRQRIDPAYLTQASQKTVAFANGSRWMQSTNFLQFTHHFIKYSNSSTDRPTLLLLD